MAEQQASASILRSRTAASPTTAAFWPPPSGDCGLAPQAVPEALHLDKINLGETQRSSLELASRDTASLASEEVAAVNIGAAAADQCESSPLQARCPTTPDDSSLQVEDDAPLCSTIAYYAHTSKKVKSGFRLPTSKKSKKFKQATPVREPIESFPPIQFPPDQQMEAVGQEDTQHSPFGHLVTPEVLALAESPILVKSKKKKKKKKSNQREEKTVKTKAKSKMKKREDIEALPEFAFLPSVKENEDFAASFKIPTKSGKHGSKHAAKAASLPESTSDTAVFGVPLETAIDRSPSHDGVHLPAFFRQCIDFIEEYGLATEGIYRVPGVNSQVKTIIDGLNRGIEFPDIPPSSPTYASPSACQSLRRTSGPFKKKSQPADSSPFESISCLSPRSSPIPPEEPTTTAEIGRLITAATCPPLAKDDLMVGSPPPHDPAVVTSVLKIFLRSLPEPVLTHSLRPLVEAACDLTDPVARMRRIGQLVHSSTGAESAASGVCLPRANRYLLAWLLQHMTRVIERSGDNKMTMANLSIVLSPTLGMSHRLLAVLLSDTAAIGNVLGEITDPEAGPVRTGQRLAIGHPEQQQLPHWLFPSPLFAYRPYVPPQPVPAAGGFELPDSLVELEEELFRQESLLAFTLRQIVAGQTSVEKEALIWEVQHLVTRMKRKKALLELTDPNAIRAELTRHEAQLDRVHRELAKSVVGTTVATTTITSVSSSSVARTYSQTTPSAGPGIQPPPSAAVAGATGHKGGRTVSSRLPVSQFDFSRRSKSQSGSTGPVGSPGSTRKHETISTVAARPQQETTSLDAEYWELQRTVTMLKRRLKMQLKASETQAKATNTPALVPSESLDAEEVLNFTLRKPPPPPPLPPAAVATDAVSMPPAQTGSSAMFTTVDSDEKRLPTNSDYQPPEVDKEERPETVTSKGLSPAAQPDAFSVHWSTFEETVIDNEPLPVVITSTTTADDTVSQQGTLETKAPTGTESEAAGAAAVKKEQTIPDPTFERLLYCLHYWTGRRQELAGIQNDLHSRIRSQKAEISRIKACIEQLLASGGKQTSHIGRCYRNAEHLLNSSKPLTGGLCSAEFDYLCPIASTLAQLMRENKRLEALNTSYVEKIIAQRNSCTDLKVLLRLNTCLPTSVPLAN
ncbi:hypothetical protein AAHC03_013989 [Spirometra sp. Aus1]